MKFFYILVPLAVLTLMGSLVDTRTHVVTYSIADKGNNYHVLLEDLESCKRIYDEEYMPDENKRASLIVQCMVIERGHTIKEIN